MRLKNTQGFTIVELLVVIVVIAILASITVVAFSGVQDRAHVAKASSVVDTVIKTAEMYKIVYGSYPNSGTGSVCIGTTENYPAVTGISAGACSSDADIHVEPAFNTLLSEFISTTPDGSLPTADNDGRNDRGVIYESNGEYIQLSFTIKNDTACPKGEKYTNESGSTSCSFEVGTLPR